MITIQEWWKIVEKVGESARERFLEENGPIGNFYVDTTALKIFADFCEDNTETCWMVPGLRSMIERYFPYPSRAMTGEPTWDWWKSSRIETDSSDLPEEFFAEEIAIHGKDFFCGFVEFPTLQEAIEWYCRQFNRINGIKT